MQLGADADGALLQRALDGQPVDDAGIAALVTIAREVEALDQRGLGAPRRLRRGAASAPARRARRLGAAPPRTADPRSCASAGGPGCSSPRRRRCSCSRADSARSRGRRCRATASIPSSSCSTGSSSSCTATRWVSAAPTSTRRASTWPRRSSWSHASTPPPGPRPPGASRSSPPTALDDAIDLARALDAATESSVTAETAAARGLPLGAAGRCADVAVRLLRRGRARRSTPSTPLRCRPSPRRPGSGCTTCSTRGRDATLRELAACSTCGEASAAARALLARTSRRPARRARPPEPATPLPAAPTTSGGPSTRVLRSPGGRTPTVDDRATRRGSSSPRPTASGGRSSGSSPGGAVRLPSVRVTSTSLVGRRWWRHAAGPLPTVTLPERRRQHLGRHRRRRRDHPARRDRVAAHRHRAAPSATALSPATARRASCAAWPARHTGSGGRWPAGRDDAQRKTDLRCMSRL